MSAGAAGPRSDMLAAKRAYSRAIADTITLAFIVDRNGLYFDGFVWRAWGTRRCVRRPSVERLIAAGCVVEITCDAIRRVLPTRKGRVLIGERQAKRGNP